MYVLQIVTGCLDLDGLLLMLRSEAALAVQKSIDPAGIEGYSSRSFLLVLTSARLRIWSTEVSISSSQQLCLFGSLQWGA